MNSKNIENGNIEQENEYCISLDINPLHSEKEHRLQETKSKTTMHMTSRFGMSLSPSIKGMKFTNKDVTLSDDITLNDVSANRKSLSTNHVTFNLKNSFREIMHIDQDRVQDRKLPQKQRFRKLSPASLGSPYGKWKKRKRMRKTSEQRRKELFDKKADKSIRSSILCISIAVSFFVLTMPSNIYGSMFSSDENEFFWNEDILSMTNFLESLNYSCNFFIYCIANSIIRKQVKNDVSTCVNYFVTIGQKMKNLISMK